MGKKLLILTSKIYPALGGVEEVVNQLSSGLSKRDWEVSVLTNFYRTEKPGLSSMMQFFIQPLVNRIKGLFFIGYMQNGYRVFETYYIFWGISFIRNILSIFLFPFVLIHFSVNLLRVRPDIINMHFADNVVFYAILSKYLLPYSKIVVSLHGVDVMKFPMKSKIQRDLLKRVIEISDKVVFVSENLKRVFESNIGELNKEKVKIVYNSVAKVFLESKPTDSMVEDKYLLCHGRLVYKKGFDTVIKSYLELEKENLINLPKLYISGFGEEEENLKLLAKSSTNIIFTRASNHFETIRLMDDALIFISPSREEPFGIVNLEAMSRKVPVISTNVGGIVEYLENDVNGILVSPDNVEQLGDAIKKLLNNTELRNSIGKMGYNTVKELFTDKVFVEKYEKVFKF